MPAGRAVCQRAVEGAPQLQTLVMGTHASALPQRTLQEEPYTYVCEGEGPYTVIHLLEELQSDRPRLDKVPGLWYRDNGTIAHNPPAENLPDLDLEIPGRASKLGMERVDPGLGVLGKGHEGVERPAARLQIVQSEFL